LDSPCHSRATDAWLPQPTWLRAFCAITRSSRAGRRHCGGGISTTRHLFLSVAIGQGRTAGQDRRTGRHRQEKARRAGAQGGRPFRHRRHRTPPFTTQPARAATFAHPQTALGPFFYSHGIYLLSFTLFQRRSTFTAAGLPAWFSLLPSAHVSRSVSQPDYLRHHQTRQHGMGVRFTALALPDFTRVRGTGKQATPRVPGRPPLASFKQRQTSIACCAGGHRHGPPVMDSDGSPLSSPSIPLNYTFPPPDSVHDTAHASPRWLRQNNDSGARLLRVLDGTAFATSLRHGQKADKRPLVTSG